MENIRETKKKMVWVDGNTLVKLVGEDEADEYLYRTGYQAKLSRRLDEINRKLKEEEQRKLNKKKVVKVQELEPEA